MQAIARMLEGAGVAGRRSLVAEDRPGRDSGTTRAALHADGPSRAILPRAAALALLILFAGCASARNGNDARVLRVGDGAATRQYPLPELRDDLGFQQLRVVEDPHFDGERVFVGFPLEVLLEHVGLGDAEELLFVCGDGYLIAFRTSVLSQPKLQALLAVRDAAMPAGGSTHWLPFRHGTELVSFDPFYLVWSSEDESIDLGTDALPWAFQLVEIQRFDRDAYFAPARPALSASAEVREGFAVYRDHCGKCHRVRGVGGEVGPALDRVGSLSSVLNHAQLSDFVRHDSARFPRSKMPDFSKLLSPAQIDRVVSYLEAMQPPR